MPKEVGPVSLWSVIADNMRRIRKERRLLQEDVATAARWVGLKWSSLTVTQIESQSRQLSVDEFLLLPLVLRCSLKDLVANEHGDQLVQLGFGTVLDAATVMELASDSGPRLKDDQVPMLPGLESPLDPKIVDAVRRAGLEDTLLSYLLVREGARGEAERKAAKTLKIAAVQITAYALRLWGRSFTEERDVRAGEQASQEKETRAVRGHITRALLNEVYQPHGLREDQGYLDPVKLKPVSADERDLRKIDIREYEKDEVVRKKANKPYERWMRFKILETLEKEGTAR